MRLINLLSLIFLLDSPSASAQYIIAGQVQPGQYSVDLQPDTTIKAPFVLWATEAMYALDMNGDGMVDYQLQVITTDGLGSVFSYCTIDPLNGNEVALSGTDSCFTQDCGWLDGLVSVNGMVRPFEYGDSIDSGAQWADSLVYLYYNYYAGGCYYCGAKSFPDTVSSYIGVRYLAGTDTIYGWIKVKDIGPIAGAVTCTIEAIAGESGTSGIAEIQTDMPGLSVAPNPASDVLHLTFDQPLPSTALLEVWDRFGRPVMQHNLSAHTSRFSPGISTLAEGVYVYSVRSAGTLPVSGKFVVAR